MNRVPVWLVYAYLWWKISDRSDDLLYRYARRYWAGVDGLIRFGILATVAFVVLVALFAYDDTCNFFGCERRLTAFLDAPANEIGDTLAGLAGGLAFLWLVVTVLLQGKELAAQRQEISLTRREMTEQRKATQDMARATKLQADIFLDEQKQRREQEARELLDETLVSLRMVMSEETESAEWQISTEQSVIANFVENTSIRLVAKPRAPFLSSRSSAKLTDDKFFSANLRHISTTRKGFDSDGVGLESPLPSPMLLQRVQVVCQKIEGILGKLSEAQKTRVSNLGVIQIKSEVDRLLDMDVWADHEKKKNL